MHGNYLEKQQTFRRRRVFFLLIVSFKHHQVCIKQLLTDQPQLIDSTDRSLVSAQGLPLT